MRKFWKIFCGMILSAVLLCGCEDDQGFRQPVVEKIEVSGTYDSGGFYLTLMKPEEMEAVLNQVRCLEPLGQADMDPERVLGDSLTIRVCLSSGRCHIYRQQADRYFSKDNKPWRKIDPIQGRRLRLFLGKLKKSKHT